MKSRTMWACLLAAGLALAVMPAFAQDTEKGPVPVITCDTPEHDFGTVNQGDEVKHTFTVKNIGKGTLKINRARGG